MKRTEIDKLTAGMAAVTRERDELRGRLAAAEAQARAFARAADTEKAEARAWRLRCKELDAAGTVAIRHLELAAGVDARGTAVRAVIHALRAALAKGPHP